MKVPEKALKALTLFNEIGPVGVTFTYGLSLQTLRILEPEATQERLNAMSPEESAEKLWQVWEREGFELIKEKELAHLTFLFGCTFGMGPAAWLLHETARLETVDRSYQMNVAKEGYRIDKRIAAVLASRPQALHRLAPEDGTLTENLG